MLSVIEDPSHWIEFVFGRPFVKLYRGETSTNFVEMFPPLPFHPFPIGDFKGDGPLKS